MAQILIFGASTAYGVGGPAGGWPDLLKKQLHESMYGKKELPLEEHEAYNLCVPGATIDDIEKRLAIEVQGYAKPDRGLIVVIELGGNDAKAVEKPDQFVNTPEKFYSQMKKLAQQAVELGAKVVLVGLQPVNEAKTNPRTNPHSGRQVFFTNGRMQLFENQIAKVAKDLNVEFVPIFKEATQARQQTDLLFDDGLHPNADGHKWLLEKIYPVIKGLI